MKNCINGPNFNFIANIATIFLSLLRESLY